MPRIELRDIDHTIIGALKEGRNVPANLADDAGLTRQYIQQRLKRLEEHGYVRNIGSGVYELVEDPRD